jgi:hypothetical protein
MVLLPLLAACATPVDGVLPTGVWGSPDLAVRVDAAGAATIERSCGQGDLGTPGVVDGALHLDFEWFVTGGAPDSGEPVGTPTTLDATVTARRIIGTLSDDDGSTDVKLVFGEEPTFFECP